jgi:hypothetical protein
MAKNEKSLANLTDEERQDIAPDAGGSGAPHLTPNKEQLETGAERPAEGVRRVRVIEAEVPEEVDFIQQEADRLAKLGDIPGDLDKVITADARARFADVVLHEDEIANAPGRYRNVDDLDEVIEIQQGARIPDGLRLIADHYIVAEPNRSALLGRRLRSINS